MLTFITAHIRLLCAIGVAATFVYVLVSIFILHPETEESNAVLYWLGDI